MPDALFERRLMGSGVFEKEKQEEGKAVAELGKEKTLGFQIVQLEKSDPDSYWLYNLGQLPVSISSFIKG